MRPLAHLQVLDLMVNMPGPFYSMILGDLGARVIKVEPPAGDPLLRTLGDGCKRQPWQTEHNANPQGSKRSGIPTPRRQRT
ncbi:MAG TPA: CoA transferase [bacterium]|nr:CoA transferase [bacterium]